MTHQRPLIAHLSLSLCPGLFACTNDGEELEELDSIEHVHFDSDEVAQILAQQPDTIFRVDLSGGTVVQAIAAISTGPHRRSSSR